MLNKDKEFKGTLRGVIALMLSMVMVIPMMNIPEKKVEAANTSFDLTAQQLVDRMGVGWNLGNTFDSAKSATGDETSWGKPYTTKEMIQGVKDAGFKTIRIPTTWTYKLSEGPDYKIDEAWINRVEEVVGYALDSGLYVILNTHHEGEHIIPTYEKQEEVNAMISMLWKQIATRFEKYGGNLIFEVLNEPRLEGSDTEWTGGTAEVREVVNSYNMTALNAIRTTGGNNAKRKVMIPSVAAATTDVALTELYIPDDDNIIVSVHAYSPYTYAMQYPGVSTWGSDSDKSGLDWEMKRLNEMFVSKGIPVIIGEFGTTNKDNLSSRITHAEYYVQAARKQGITCVWWDNGNNSVGAENFGIYDRQNLSWYYPELVSKMIASEASVAGDYDDNHTNGNYEGNILSGDWKLYDNNGSATKISDHVITISSIGTENWQPHYYHSDISIEEGIDTVFTCTIKSSIDRNITIHMQRPDNNYETLAAQTITLKAGIEKQVSIFVAAPSESKTGIKLSICLGAIEGVTGLAAHTVEIINPVWAREIVEEETTEEDTTVEEETTSKESPKIEINGWQISTIVEGYRVLYSVSDPNQEVEEMGLVYGLADFTKEEDMVINSTNDTVYSYKATQAGKTEVSYSDMNDAYSYAMTMKFINTAEFYEIGICVRAYVKLKDGTYLYSDIEECSVYDLADYLYSNVMMNTVDKHNYLFSNILTVVNSEYKYIEYAWDNVIVAPY